MKVRHVSEWCMVTALAAIGTGFGLGKAIAAEPGPAGAVAGVEVLTRGPVHEAFAETVTFDPQPGIVVPKAPPAPIEEVPPDQKPEGANVAWIPGYWGWDDDRSDYLWVSGIWRALPPGRQWVPGYWGQSGQGFQWTSGYWADATVSEVEYLPAPPPTVEAGPNIAAPSADYGWVPGSWVWHRSWWHQGRYAWRPGYWVAGRQDWDWVPAHYIWAPRGYVFSDGYWDYPVSGRGVLFAPVYFNAGVYARPDFHYSPSVVIDLGVFTDHLFVRPNYSHYYFGDYYAPAYQDRGISASFSFNSSRYGYDPIYAHQRWEHRQEPEWEHRVQADFQSRRDHEDARPPRTLAAQVKLLAGAVKSSQNSQVVATQFNQMASRKDTPLRFQPVANEERQQLTQRRQEVQKFTGERQQLETRASPAATEKPARISEPAKVKLSRSPIVAKSADQLGKGQAPPKRPDAPKPDLKVEPKPRKAGGTAEPPKGESKAKRVERAEEPKGESKGKGK
jgi:hypothetical protein